MEEQKKTQALGATFYGSVTFNGPMFHIHDNEHVHIHSEQCTKQTSLHASEEETKEVILALLEATDEEGHRIFTEKSQWYAVYKVLSECHGYPSNIREFCDIMKNWRMDEVSPACTYNSVRRIPSDIPKSTTRVALWNNYKNKADEKFKKQIIVANQLMEMLEK